MNENQKRRDTYDEPAIVLMGSVEKLTRKFNQNDICDQNPCTGNWRNFTDQEKGKALSEIQPDHEHDPKKPLQRPK